MPAKYYHKELGDCDFFFLDTNFEWQEKEEIQEQYNTMLQLCVACHQQNCPGPIKKIQKLRISK